MSRGERERLLDIAVACAAITDYIERSDVGDDVVFDAIRIRLVEIGEAVKELDPSALVSEPHIPGPRSPACATCSPTGTSTPPMRSSRQPPATTSRNWPLQSSAS